MDPATIRFRHILPYAIFPASPSLAALHAIRARTLDPDHVALDYPFCSCCGSLLVQYHRTCKNKRHKRILRRSCRICGAVTLSQLPTAPFPPARNNGTITLPPPTAEPMPPSPPKSLSPTYTNAPPKQQQARSKKKSGLQHLLARNREKEERELQKQNQTNNSQLGGLAAFLSDL